MVFGYWHPFLYGHVLIWNEFRHTFLGPAFFALFPTQMLMFRPKLIQSSTFFTWLRLAYPTFRGHLVQSISVLRARSLAHDVKSAEIIVAGGSVDGSNPFRARMTHMQNLFYLLDVFIPVLHDYGATLKSNDFELFNSVFLRLFLLFLIARDRGAATYRNPMFVYILQTMYWCAKQLPMCLTF
jgi:hypothetical protein